MKCCEYGPFISVLAYLKVKGRTQPLRGSPTSISLGWKGLSGTNALAYYEHS
jgi:hypothetical protein